jgi:GNAT superfamily N-acetyltransferase
MTPNIREATLADVPALMSLYEDAGLDAPGENDRSAAADLWAAVRAVGGGVLVAEGGGRALGTLTFFVWPLLAHRGRPGALVEDVAVHPDAQGLGIGRALMDEAMARARQAGCYKLALSSNARRTEAHAFYERLGYGRHGVSFTVPLENR